MKLRFSSTSPYVRKVTVTALEIGLDSRIERVVTNTMDRGSGIAKDNPLADDVDAILSELKRERFIADLHQRWFGEKPSETSSTVVIVERPRSR